jgi:signal transduction histidine kinase
LFTSADSLALLELSLTGITLLRPLYGPAGEVEDFALDYLNPAAQRMAGLTEQPGGTLRTHFPDAFRTDVFAFYRHAFETGEAGHFRCSYQADGQVDYYHLAARRSGERLLVSSDQDRRPIEAALRASQAREQAARAEAERQHGELQRLFEQAPVAMALFQGPDYVIELANQPMATIWGRPLTQVLGQPVFDALPYVRNQGFEALFADVLAQGSAHYLPEVPVTIDRAHTGQPTLGYFNLTYRPQRDGQGQITGIFTIAQEVTEQVVARQRVEQLNQELEARVAERTRQLEAKQTEALAAAERRVQEREELYQMLAQTTAALAITRGADHRYVYANSTSQALFAGRQLVGHSVAEALPEAVSLGLLALLDKVYETGETFFGTEWPLPFASPAGDPDQVRYFNFTYQAYREEGQIVGTSTFAYDVTEQVRARQERETQQGQLEQLFMQAPAPIVILDGPELVYQLVNPTYQQIFPGRQLLGLPLLVALPELASSPIPALLQHVYRTGETYLAHELPLQLARHAGGPLEEIYWTFTYQARRTVQQQVDGVLVFAHEVTEQVRTRQLVEQSQRHVHELNQQLAVINEQLQATNADLGESNTRLTRTNVDLDTFVYTASHDLKAPITNIEGILAALRENLPPAVQQDQVVAHLLGLLDMTVSRFLTTITDLTDLARLQQSYDEPAELLALAPVVAGVVDDLTPAIAAAGAALHLEVPAALHVSFAPAGLRSIVYNLLSNAVKYRAAERPAQVWLWAEVQPGALVLRVRDNGLGLTPAQQLRLFKVFQRLHTHVPGTGVGLYMIKRLIDNAGARISVSSEPGVGSTFTVTFPA